jgi:hypothetical protein
MTVQCILVVFALLLFGYGGKAVSQEFPEFGPNASVTTAESFFRPKITVASVELLGTCQIETYFERNPVGTSNSHLLNYLFATSTTSDRDRLAKSRNPGLSLSSIWYSIASASRLVRSTPQNRPRLEEVELANQFVDEFLALVAAKANCDVPEVWKNHIKEAELTHGRIVFGFKPLKSPASEAANVSEAAFLTKASGNNTTTVGGITADFSHLEPGVGCVLLRFGDSLAACFADEKKGPQAICFGGNVWQSQLDTTWQDSEFEDVSFYLVVSHDGANLVIFHHAVDRIGLNVIDAKTGALIWNFNSDWPAILY